jgi:hypothetical protein
MSRHNRFSATRRSAQPHTDQTTNPRGISDNLSDFLRMARPSLITFVELAEHRVTAMITEGENDNVVVLDEYFDPHDIKLRRAIYRRIVVRENETFYFCTYLATRDEVFEIWGQSGLLYCDPVTALAVVRIEMSLEEN